MMATSLAFTQAGNLRIFDSAESTGAIYAFLRSSIATNRATPQQLSNAQTQLGELSAALRGQRNPPATAIGAVDPQTGRIVTATSGDVPTYSSRVATDG